MDLNDIKMSDIKNLKSELRIRCPYCGDEHILKRENDSNDFSMECTTWSTRPKMFIKFVEKNSRIFLKTYMDYPCACLRKVKEGKIIPLDTCKQANEGKGIKITKVIRISNFLDAVKSDMSKSNPMEFYNPEIMETALRLCWKYSATNKKSGDCYYCCSTDYGKKGKFDMLVTIEFILEFNDSQDEKEKVEKTKEEQNNIMPKPLPIDINQMAEDLGIKFGLNTDERIKSTILGTVVEYDKGKFRGFDRNEKVMTEYSNLATISLPSVLLPATTVKVGDTIIHSGEPFFILKAKKGEIWGANPLTSKEEKILPIANPLGIETYTRLISVGELLGFKGSESQKTKIFFWFLSSVTNNIFSEGVDSANDKIRELTSKGAKYVEILVPFVFVAFAAYAIKGDGMRVENLSQMAKDNFGIDFECLKDEKLLKKITTIGIATTAIVTYFNSTVKKVVLEGAVEDYNKDEIVKDFDEMLKKVKACENTIQEVLPVAIVICALKIFNESNFEKFKDKIEGFMLIAQDKLCDKFEIDEEIFSKENLEKFGFAIGIAITIFIVYGKKVEGKDKSSETIIGLIEQIIPVIAPLIPAILIFAPDLKTFFEKLKK